MRMRSTVTPCRAMLPPRQPSPLPRPSLPHQAAAAAKEKKVAPGLKKRGQEEKENLVAHNGANVQAGRQEGKREERGQRDTGKAGKAGPARGEAGAAPVEVERQCLDVVKESVGMIIGKKVHGVGCMWGVWEVAGTSHSVLHRAIS